jgi:hypothetical protein
MDHADRFLVLGRILAGKHTFRCDGHQVAVAGEAEEVGPVGARLPPVLAHGVGDTVSNRPSGADLAASLVGRKASRASLTQLMMVWSE